MRLKRQSLKICFATASYPPDVGGVARSSARISRYLCEEGLDVHIFTPMAGDVKDSGLLTSSSENGINVHRVTLPRRAVIPRVADLRRAIETVDQQERFDLFHGFFLTMAYPCIDLALRSGRPLIASIRGSDAVRELHVQQRRDAIKAVLKSASWITSVSTDLLEKAAGLEDISDRSSVILNSIDTASFPKWRVSEANRGVVGTMAEFREKKNLPLLIQSYAEVSAGLRRKLLLVGGFADEVTKTESENIIRRNGLAPEALLTGFVGDVEIAQLLLAMRVFVVCSNHDGLPNALLEAAAAGVPIVSTNVGGMRDILNHGESALLVPPNDKERLVAALESVLKDDGLAAQLSEGALRVARDLTPDREKQAWLELYERVLTAG